MSVTDINVRKSEKRMEELKHFLFELDSMADKLYARLEFKGVWDILMKLEDTRVQYYVEYYEHERILKLKGK